MISQPEVKEGHCPSSHSLSQQRQLALHSGKSHSAWHCQPGAFKDTKIWRKRNMPTTKLYNLREQAYALIVKHKERTQYCTETMGGGPQSLVLKLKVLSGHCTGSYKSSFLHFSCQRTHRVYSFTTTPPLGHLEIKSYKPQSLCTIQQTQGDAKYPLPYSKMLLLHSSP